jgi:RNA polymerase sigma factor (sigma-70 family)
VHDVPASIPAAELTPAELVHNIASGDQAAETEMVRRYSAKIEFILRRRCRDFSMAADLRQETFIVVLQRLRERGIDDPDRLAAFIYQTAINLAIGEARTYHRRNTHPDWELVANVADQQPLLSDQIEQEQRGAMIRKTLGQLRQPRDRQILRRYYLTEEPKQSICAALNVSAEHFDRVLFRARARFRKLLEKQVDL